MAPTTPAPGLARSIRRWDLVGVVLNGVIGAGIFGLPSKVFALAGTYSLFAFGLCALCVSFIVLSFAEVASRFTGSGGPYLYARANYGSLAGFTIGWLVWIARITSFAANCSLLPVYLGFFFPGAASGLGRAVIITVVVSLLGVVNVVGVRPVANASNAFVFGKLLPLAIFVIVGFFFLDPARFSLAAAPAYRPFAQAVLLLVYAFTGFEMGVIPAGEVRNPERTLPAALLTGMAIVVTFYVLIQVVCIGTLPELAASRRPLADAANRFLGAGGAAMITFAIVMSLAGNLNVLILSASRIIFAMGELGDLPPRMAEIHPHYRTPIASVLATVVVMLALTLSGTFIYLVALSTISRLVTYFATCSVLPIMRRKAAHASKVFLMPGGVPIAFIGMAIVIWLLSNCTLVEVRDTAIALSVGLLFYTLARRAPGLKKG
ncbi:MAG TPA: APC family permease [Bryobacteraceae bacterium]|nr:APC family permease [Bryobacteraceae bacterium]